MMTSSIFVPLLIIVFLQSNNFFLFFRFFMFGVAVINYSKVGDKEGTEAGTKEIVVVFSW